MMSLIALISAIVFWFLCVAGVIALACFIYVESQYYHWNKELHDGTIVDAVYQQVKARIDEVNYEKTEDEKKSD